MGFRTRPRKRPPITNRSSQASINPNGLPPDFYSNPALANQLYNAPVPAGVDRLSNADSNLEGAHDVWTSRR